MGHIDFAGIVAVLKASGYEGFLSAEIVQIPDGATAARRAYAHLRALTNSHG
jgi:sugar phosphate isomerase/epimerase